MTTNSDAFGHRVRRRSLALVIATAVVMYTMAGVADPNTEKHTYLLGSGDELRIKVFEWRTSIGDVHEWKVLNADYKVGAAGEISLPLLGEVTVAGMTTEAVARTISERLKEKVGLTSRPEAAVEITRFRPVFIVGEINKPGEYAFRPEMTVLQAVAIAGGLVRDSDPKLLEIERSVIDATGTWRVLIKQRTRLLLQAARLQAERDGKDTIILPTEDRESIDPSSIADLVKEQEAILKARRANFQSKIAGYGILKDLLGKELSSLGARTVNTEEQLTMIRKELASITNLVKQGLATSPREFALRQNDVEIQGRRLDLDTAILHAREAIARLDQQITDLQNERRDEIFRLRQETDAQLGEVGEKIITQERLIKSYLASRPYLAAKSNTGRQGPTYTLVRRVGQGIHEQAAMETTIVEPGDTIRVSYPADMASVLDRSLAANKAAPDVNGSPVK